MRKQLAGGVLVVAAVALGLALNAASGAGEKAKGAKAHLIAHLKDTHALEVQS